MRITLLVLLFSLSLSSCIYPPSGRLDTSTGEPELFIRNGKLKKVQDLCAANLQKRGFMIETVSDYAMIGYQPVNRSMEETAFDVRPQTFKWAFNFLAQDSGVMVRSRFSRIKGRGQPDEEEIVMNDQKILELQQSHLMLLFIDVNPK
jgi:hypothetical protein